MMKTGLFVVWLFLSCSVVDVNAYKIENGGITTVNGSINTSYQVGTSVKLKCKGSSSYEHCNWYHNSVHAVCKFEYTYSVGELKPTHCNKQFIDRIKFVGNYTHHECNIILNNISKSDEGKWKCELQKYVFGPFPGAFASKEIYLKIDYTNQEKGICDIILIIQICL